VRGLGGRVRLAGVVALVAMLTWRVGAVTRLPSADGQFWDIQDTSPWSQDSGGIATGGRANPFNGFGYLKMRVRQPGGATLVPSQYLTGFGLAHDGERFDTITPVLHGDVLVSRGLFAPADANYLRYVDSYTNASRDNRVIDVAWGGAAGAFEDGGPVTVAASSNGNRTIDLADTFVTVMQNAKHVADPEHGPSGHGPSAHVLGSHAAGLLTSVGDMYADPFTNRWPGYDPAHIGYVFTLTVKPGETVALMTFVVKGLSEAYDPRGGFPNPAARCAGGAQVLPAVCRRRAAYSGGRIRDCPRDRRRSTTCCRAGSPRADAVAAFADRQLARGGGAVNGAAVHGRRKDGPPRFRTR